VAYIYALAISLVVLNYNQHNSPLSFTSTRDKLPSKRDKVTTL